MQVLIFGDRTYFQGGGGGMIRRSEKSCKEGVCSIECFLQTTRCCACFSDYGYFQDTGVLIFGGGGGGNYFRGIAADSKFQ